MASTIKKAILAASIALISFNAQATLTSYNANGVDVVYSSVSDVTWTKDGNLFKTLYASNSNLINDISAITPVFYDTTWYPQTINFDDYDAATGAMTWFGAKAFGNYLNSISYGGSKDWRLSSAGIDPFANLDIAAPDAEMGQLYYTELGKKSSYASPSGGYGIFGDNSYDTTGDVGPFINVKANVYWTNEENKLSGVEGWFFNTRNGFQYEHPKTSQFYAWFVTSGQIATVPEPENLAMLLAGLGLIGIATRRNKKA